MKIRTIALVAHDNCKKDLIEWVRFNRGTLERYRLVCTGTTGRLVQEALEEDGQKDLNITRLKSGPLGGDQQLGALIAEEVIDMIVFFWDPMQPQPHDVDVKALLRISNLYNIPTAYNPSFQGGLRQTGPRLLRLPQPGTERGHIGTIMSKKTHILS